MLHIHDKTAIKSIYTLGMKGNILINAAYNVGKVLYPIIDMVCKYPILLSKHFPFIVSKIHPKKIQRKAVEKTVSAFSCDFIEHIKLSANI